MLNNSDSMVSAVFSFPWVSNQQYISIQLAALRKPSGAGGTPVRYWSLIEGDSGVCERDLPGKVSVDT